MSQLPKCEPCRVNEIDADAVTIVSGEPWCDVCVAYHACECERCGDLTDVQDAHHGDDHEACCYDCGQEDATNE